MAIDGGRVEILVPLGSFHDPIYKRVMATAVMLGEYGAFFVHRRVTFHGLEDEYVVTDDATKLAVPGVREATEEMAIATAMAELDRRGLAALVEARAKGARRLAGETSME